MVQEAEQMREADNRKKVGKGKSVGSSGLRAARMGPRALVTCVSYSF